MHPRSHLRPLATLATVLALTMAAAVVAAPVMPYSKPGLWVITQHVGTPAKTFETKLCIDKATQADLIDAGGAMAKSMCSKDDMTGGGNRLQIDAVCRVGPSTVTSRTIVTYAGDSAFQSVTDGQFSPAFMGKTTTHGTIDAKWSGACPAGMAPGDMTGPNGIRLHMGPNGPVPIH
jgi:hypothetical protein